MAIGKRHKTRLEQLYINFSICNALAMVSDILAVFFEVYKNDFSFYAVRIFNFSEYACNFLLVILSFSYVTAYLSDKATIPKFHIRIVTGVIIIFVGLLTANIWFPIFYSFNPDYIREPLFWLSQAPGIFGLLYSDVFLVIYEKYLDTYEKFAMLSYITLPIFAIILHLMFYGIAFLSFANTISIIIIFIFLQSERERTIAEQEKEITVNQLNITLSQIQPHFLNNALNTIQYLCDTNPRLASETVGKFSKYMRMNLESLSQNHAIPFKNDLEHLENYLSIEKLRFPDIKFIYDIKATDFSVPPLTLQPLVENAIRHGVRQLESGGIIEISTFCKDNNNVIVIKDNGGGFDVATKPNDNRTHVGLSNTKNRLNIMCNGEMSVDSKIGIGTKITIQIPIQ